MILDGIRVFDMTLAAVGPWASKLLGQLGADVIHVEAPRKELAHHIPPEINGTGVLYISANFNKRNIELDLKNDADRETAYRIAAQCDIFVQNMRPGAAEKLGLGYDEISRVRPDIIYVSASAYGRVGPMASEAGVDPLLQAFCGWSAITGPPGSDGEMFRHFAHIDVTTSSTIVESVLAALIHRERTGEGQHIEIEMLTTALSLQATRLGEYFATGEQPEPLGSAAATTVPHEAFRCLDGEWLALGAVDDDQWTRLCRALGLDAELFPTNPDRVRQRDAVVASVGEVIATKPVAWWTRLLTKHRVPNSRVMDFDRLRHDPQVVANGLIDEIDTPHWGRLTVDAAPWQFDKTPVSPNRPGGLHGEHSDEILAELT